MIGCAKAKFDELMNVMLWLEFVGNEFNKDGIGFQNLRKYGCLIFDGLVIHNLS